jgi:hypothetical protein
MSEDDCRTVRNENGSKQGFVLVAAMLINLLSSCGQSRRFCRLALAQFFHANLVRVRAQYPTIYIVDSCAKRRMAAMFAYADKVAPFKCGNQFARVLAVTVFFNGHAPNGLC